MFDTLALPTPFQVGPVNAYVAGRTVVDPGPDSEEAWTALCEGLAANDLVPDDVTQVLVTHPHPDHFGAARRLRDRGARVLASPQTAAIVGDFRARLEHEQTYFRDFFERCGLDADTAATVTQLPEAFLPYVEDVAVDRELGADDTVTVADTTLAVDTLAGHAPGELSFAFEADGTTAIVGDQVLPDITPNPFLQPPPESDAVAEAAYDTAEDGRPLVLPAYNDSLATLRDRGFDRLLPGHREPIEDPAGRIDAILDAHETRTARVRDIVDGPTTPVEVMETLFDDLPATEAFSGMSEAVGHLDVLEARGTVTHTERGGLLVYEPSA